MNEPFVLEVTYQNQALEFPAAFQRYGYTYRIVVTIHELNYVFEPDEEGQYRVLGAGDAEPGLLAMIAKQLQQLQK